MMTSQGLENPAFSEDNEKNENKKNDIEMKEENQKQDVETGEKSSNTDDYGNPVIGILMRIRRFMSVIYNRHRRIIKGALITTILLLYLIYLIALIRYVVVYKVQMDWCNGQGFFIIITCFAVFLFMYYQVKKHLGRVIKRTCVNVVYSKWRQVKTLRYTNYVIYLLLLLIAAIFLFVDARNDLQRLRSALGLVVLLLLGFIFSKDPSKIIWSQVWWGVGLQFVFACLILKWGVGASVFQCLGNKTNTFLSFTDTGSSFVYGSDLVDKKTMYFQVLSIIFFFSFTVQILQYYGVMQLLVKKMGWLLYVTVGTTACESMNAAANIFLGQTEAPLMIKPYLHKMTNSELHAVMSGGFATIAGTVLAAYIGFGVNASHLLGASVMSAPAALAFAKLFYPETKVSETTAENIEVKKGDEANFLDAAAKGASAAIMLVLNIAANLIAFTAAINFLNAVVAWFSLQLGNHDVDFKYILAHIFWPLAWVMGVPEEDCLFVGELLGIKTVVNEFVAYEMYGDYVKSGGVLNPRTDIIIVYSLCGFSNLTAIGIQIGALSKMAPSRDSDFAKIAFRAFLSGSAACFMTACIAGMLVSS